MLIKHQLSNGTWGRVLSLRDDKTNQVAPRPSGKTKTVTHTEDVTIEVTPTDPQAAKDFAPMTLRLGSKTWSRTIPDVDPLWQQWDDAGFITEELLADVPEPAEVIAERDLAAAKASKEEEVKAELIKQEEIKKREAHPELYAAKDAIEAATTVEDVIRIVVIK